MLDAKHRHRASAAGTGLPMTGLWPHIRLFGLLALLAPLFLGLQYLVQESVPQIEVRFITPDAQAAAQPPAERVVERVVYVPVEKVEPAPLRDPASGPLQTIARSSEPVKLTGMDSTAAVAAAPAQAAPLQEGPEQPAAEPVADAVASDPVSGEEPTVHMGVVSVVTPVVAAAPPARAVVAQSRYVAPVVVAAPIDEEEPVAVAEEAVAEEPAEAAPVVAEAEPMVPTEQVAEIKVLETMLDGSQTTRVVSYRVPVHRPAPAQQAQPEPAVAPEAVAEEPEAAAPEGAEEAAAAEDEAAAPEEEAGVEVAADLEQTPVSVDDQPLAIENDPIAEDVPSGEALDGGAGDETVAEAPADARIEEDEPIAVEVAEIERPNPAEPTVSSVSVTTVMIEPGQ